MLILGVDEAGKGPVIGSMFIAGFVADESKLFDLAAMGVRDSKGLSPSRREAMARKLYSLADGHYVMEVAPGVIDELRQVMTMNEIMVRCFSQVVSNLNAGRAILDAADVNADRFGKRVKAMSGTKMEIVSEHKADRNHRIVGAASILAKVRRDQSIRELEMSMNCKIGSGYPADQDTIDFLTRWAQEHKALPPFARHSWATAKNIKARFI